MAALPAPILPKVARLLRMMGSPVDGEALNAARALSRTLQGAGVDWHALAEAVERPAVVIVDRPKPEPQARRGPQAGPGDVELDFAQRRNVVEALRRELSGSRMTEWEKTFAASILTRLQDGHGRLTGKQGDALGRLLARLGEGAAWA